MKFCPECGTKFEPESRICPECGYERDSVHARNETGQVATDQTKAIQKTEPAHFPLLSVQETAPPKKSKKFPVWIILSVVGVVALVIVGILIFNKHPEPLQEAPVVASLPLATPAATAKDTAAMDTAVKETTKTAAPEPAKVKTAPQNKTAKETSKTKPKVASKPEQQKAPAAQPVTTPPNQEKPEPVVSPSPETATTENVVKVIMEVGRKDDPKNQNPKNPTKLIIRKPTMIVRITTDHYNGGVGTAAAGTLTIKDKDDNLIGAFPANGKPGINGTPNAKWIVEPNKVLEKGTYFIVDSDMATWSKNIVGMGCIVIEGYEIKQPAGEK